MKGFSKFLMYLCLVVVVGGAVFFAFWDIPAPVENVQEPITHDMSTL